MKICITILFFLQATIAFAVPQRMSEHKMRLEYCKWIKSQSLAKPEYKNIVVREQKEVLGFPDVEILVTRWPQGRSSLISGYFLEFGIPPTRQLPSSIEWQRRLTKQGYLYTIVNSLDEAKSFTQEYISLPPVVVP